MRARQRPHNAQLLSPLSCCCTHTLHTTSHPQHPPPTKMQPAFPHKAAQGKLLHGGVNSTPGCASIPHRPLQRHAQPGGATAQLSAARVVTSSVAATQQTATQQAASNNNAPSDAARKVLFGTATEQVNEAEATVTGQLPAWLSGSLLVNGGGDYSRMRHMFDGYACLTKVKVAGGKAWGSQRYLDTNAYKTYTEQGKVVYREFATPPETDGFVGEVQNLLSQLFGLMTKNPKFTDNASVSLAAVDAAAARSGSSGSNGRLVLAMSETPAANYLINPDDLSTVEQVQYTDGLPGDLSTAHPSILSDGSLLNFTRSLPNGGFHIYRQDPHTLKRSEVAFVPDRHPMSPAWVHDFAATDKYAVIIEHPLYMQLGSLLLNTPSTHIFMDWKPEDEVRVHLVSLDGSKAVRSFTCPTFFFFHVGNAFESADGSCLHVDLAGYEDPQILLDLGLDPLRQPRMDAAGGLQQQVSTSGYWRLTIPLQGEDGGRLQAPQPLAQPESHGSFCEFPAINPNMRGQPYRFAYFLSAVRPTNMGNALSKVDLQTGAVQTWHTPGGAVGEPLFIQRPGSTAEEDGVVVAPGIDAEGRGLMVVMDPATWTEAARVQLPFGVPNRFHGMWLPSS